MKSRDTILASLRAMRPQLAERYGVDVIGIVGSWARGEARRDSDLDVAFDLVAERKVSLFDLGGVAAEIEDEVGIEVDLVDWKTLRPRLKEIMKQDIERL